MASLNVVVLLFCLVAMPCAFNAADAETKKLLHQCPPPFPKCVRDDPNVNECLKNAIQSAIRYFKNGYTPLDMSALYPLNIIALDMVSAGGANCSLRPYDVYGLENVLCESAKYVAKGANEFYLSFALLLPRFSADGQYQMQHDFLGGNHGNNGSFTFNLTDYRAEFYFRGAVWTGQDGAKYARLKGLSANFTAVTRPQMAFSNLRGGAPLGDADALAVLHAYKTAIDLLHPVLAQSYANVLLESVPFDDLFPPTAKEAKSPPACQQKMPASSSASHGWRKHLYLLRRVMNSIFGRR